MSPFRKYTPKVKYAKPALWLGVAALVSVCLLNAPASAAGPCSVSGFGPPVVSGTGSVHGIVVADFNGDGKADLATANEFTDDVSVLLGNGDGTFAPAATFAAGKFPRSIDAGDFNGDGKLDLVTGNDINVGGGDVTIMFGDGTGRFPTKKGVNIETSPTVSFVTVADFNKDGKADLLIGNASTDVVAVLLGDGAGNFPNTTFYHTGPRPAAGAAVDLNGDGKLDLAVISPFGNTVSVLIGDGNGGFSAAANFGAGPFPTSLTTGDFNGDGKLDIATANEGSGIVSVLLGDGSGAFAPAVSYGGGGQSPFSIAAADFNGDGKLDLAVANNDVGSVSILQGDGAGHFSAASNYIGGASVALTLSAKDLNGDGLPDLIVGSQDTKSVATLLNTCGAALPAPAVQFYAPTYIVQEAAGVGFFPVVRTGSLAGEASIDYATSDGTATARQDYTSAYGRLQFGPGEASKYVQVMITDDRLAEGDEDFTVALGNPTGAVLSGPVSADVTIRDNDLRDGPSPVGDAAFNADFFVQQHYSDFLNREPDTSGFNFWTNNITSCGADANCVAVKRVDTSAAFFLSIEFQNTGYFVYKTYKAAFGDVPGAPVPVRLRPFLVDTQRIGQGVVVGQGNWQQQLDDNKTSYALSFVQRPDFQVRYPAGVTAAQFVDALFSNAGITPTTAERQAAIGAFGASDTTGGRAAALRSVADSQSLQQGEFNRAFVLMQYFGYLRRDPDSTPDSDFSGYDFWLSKLNQFNGNFVQAEMVKAFITSTEYRQRFGQP